MELISKILYLSSGFVLLASLHHFFISLNNIDRKEHLSFSISTVPIVFYVFAMDMIYTATTVEEILLANRVQMFCTPIFFIFFSRFATYLCQKTPSLFLTVISVIYGLIPFIRIFSENLLTYKNIRGIKTVTLPWGEHISQLDTDTTLFASLYYLFVLFFLGYLLKLSIETIRTNNYKKGKALFVTLIIFLLTALNDVLLDTLNLNWLYMGEYGFVAIIVVMSFYLSQDVYKAQMLRKKMEQSEKLLSAISENAPAVIHIKDLDGRYIMINGEFEKIFHTDRHDIIGKTDFDVMDEPIAKAYTLNDNEVKKAKKAIQFEEAVPHEDGPHVYISNKFPVYNEDGEVYAVGGISTDISEKRNLEVRLRQSDKMQAVGQLAGGVAHDFNNQLAGIIGYADLIKETCGDDSVIVGYVKSILIAAKRSSELTGQLLAFARKGKYQSAKVNVHEIIEETINLLKRSVSKKIVLKNNFRSKNPFVLGDSTQLQNIILNLAMNSCDAIGDEGELQILTESTFLDESFCKESSYMIKPGMYLQITVEDDGSGIPEDTIGRIFEPFYTTKQPGKGTGMGLSAVYGTVKNHNGAIDVKSETNKGTIFNIYLPEAEKGNDGEVEKNSVKKVIKGTGRILIVDDESVIRRVVSSTLTSLGYSVVNFEKGKDAIEYFKENSSSVDLVIIDLIMPEMDGKDVFNKLIEIDPKVKTLISSGFSIDGSAQELLDMGAKGFIQKPFRKSEISTMIAEIMNS